MYIAIAVLENWIQRGENIVGEDDYDMFGWSVFLSSDGDTVVIGAPFNGDGGFDAGGFDSGHVRVYHFDNDLENWIQLRKDIDWEKRNDRSGWSVSLSSDGDIV